MALGSITTSTTIYASNSAAVPGLNDIRTGLTDLLVTGYGATAASSPVVSGTIITAAAWAALSDDIQRIQVHQTNSILDFGSGAPVSGGISKAAFANTLTTTINTAYENSTTVAESQVGIDNSNAQSIRTTAWGSTITHGVTYTWLTANAARIFFNLGGTVETTLTRTMPGSPTPTDTAWGDLIATAATRLTNFRYGWDQYTSTTATWYAGWTGSQVSWTSTASNVATNNGDAVRLSVQRSGSTVIGTVSLIVSGSPTINVLPANIFINRYSRGDVAVSGYYGIAAPRPAVQTTTDLQTGGSIITPPPNTKILSVNSLSPFSFVQNTVSANQTVQLTNSGNTPLTVTGITYTENGGVIAVGEYPWVPAFPKVINSGTTITYPIAYTGPNTGTFYNSFTISSDNDAGPVTVQTQQIVSAPAFTFSLSPTSWTRTVTTPDTVEQKFTIVPNDGSTPGTNYSFGWASGTTTGFTLTQSPDGPTVSFNPNASGVTNTTYSPLLSVTYNGVTKTAPVSITRNLPVDYHLGDWVSAIQTNNSVVGISYDVIGNQRYLTLGFTLGEDGSPSNAFDPSYSSYINVSSLGLSADTKYSSGVVAYEMLHDPVHIQFLRDYGVWIRSNSELPYDTYVQRTYKVTFPTSEQYAYKMSIDNDGYFTIDGVTIGDLRGYGSSAYTSVFGDVFDMTAGEHDLTWAVSNAFNRSGNPNQGGIAIQIIRTSDNFEVWNTKSAVRSTPAYQYWQEVYRIPIAANGTPQTYYSKNYYIKNSNAAYANSFGYYFGSGAANGSLFTVVDVDGTGLLDITFNFNSGTPPSTTYTPDTINFLFLPYYYSAIPNSRITQLEDGPIGDGTQTTFFQGFNRNGSIRTTLRTYPASSGGGGGGGCPDPETAILIPGYNHVPAGELKVGDTILTVHEKTGQLGEYQIAAMGIEDQPKVQITLDDGTSIKVSDTHKFLLDGGIWKQVFDLHKGDKIQTISATRPLKEIVDIEEIGMGPVVKLEVKEAHTYIAAGLVSHNIKINPPDSQLA